jgi:hypothetical protein
LGLIYIPKTGNFLSSLTVTNPNLVTKINKLEKNSKGIKPLVVLERLLNIINKYDVNSHIEMEVMQENANDITPTIVISQSYV